MYPPPGKAPLSKTDREFYQQKLEAAIEVMAQHQEQLRLLNERKLELEAQIAANRVQRLSLHAGRLITVCAGETCAENGGCLMVAGNDPCHELWENQPGTETAPGQLYSPTATLPVQGVGATQMNS
jgi:hypothetical protein